MHEFPQTYDIAPTMKKVPPEFLVGAIVGAGVALLRAAAPSRRCDVASA